jgi:group I intron endonuclease
MIIYVTTNIINGKKYIGKDSHNNPKYLGSGVLLKEDIKKYGRKSFKKEILEYCNTDEDLTLRETYWINYFDALQSNLYYNLVDFSAGWNIHKLGEEKYNNIVQRISKLGKGICKPQLSNNQERKDKLRQANINKPKPKGFGEVISNIKTGKPLPEGTGLKISEAKKGHICYSNQNWIEAHYKAVEQVDKENNIVCEYKSIKEIIEKNLTWKRANISCCLTGKSKTAYGFKFRYKKY